MSSTRARFSKSSRSPSASSARTGRSSVSMAPASMARRVARASDHDAGRSRSGPAGPRAPADPPRVDRSPASRARTRSGLAVPGVRATRSGRLRRAPLDLGAARPGPSGSGTTSAAHSVHPAAPSVSAGMRETSRSSRPLRHRQRRRRSRQPPSRAGSRGAHVRLLGRRLAQQQRHQLPAAPPALVLHPGPCLRVPLHRVGRDLLDVREDRLGQQADRLRVEVRPPRRLRHPPPRHPRSHAVGRLQRVERPSLPQLAAAERHVHLAPRPARARRAADHRQELAQRLGHPGPHTAPERPLERPRVLRHLARDRGHDLLGDGIELGLDHVRHARRERLPGAGLHRSCHRSE